MSSIGRWVLTHAGLETVVHGGFTSIPVGTTLLSSLVRDYWCVGLKARTETLCPCCKRASELRLRRAMVSNRETRHTLRASALLRRRASIGLPLSWVVWVAPLVPPLEFSPFVNWDCFFSVFRVDYISACTRAKHGRTSCVTGGSDPRELWAAESRPKWGRSRPSECFARVQILWFRFTHLLTSLLFVVPSPRKLV